MFLVELTHLTPPLTFYSGEVGHFGSHFPITMHIRMMHHHNSTTVQNHTPENVPLFPKVIPKVVYILGMIENTLLLAFILARFIQQRIRSVNLFIANLAFASWFTAFFSDSFIWDLRTSPYCAGLTFLKGLFYHVGCATVLSISYDRLRRLRSGWGNCSLSSILFYIWTLCFLWAIPCYFEVTFDKKSQQCFTVELLGDKERREIFSTFRFYAFHTMLSFLLTFCSWDVHGKFQYLCQKTTCRKRKRRVNRVRLICINPLLFLMTWIPYGILHYLQTPENELFPVFMDLLIALYLALLPILTYWTSDDLAFSQERLRGKCCDLDHRRPTNAQLVDLDNDEEEEEEENIAEILAAAEESGDVIIDPETGTDNEAPCSPVSPPPASKDPIVQAIAMANRKIIIPTIFLETFV